jgi:hypothetical protein
MNQIGEYLYNIHVIDFYGKKNRTNNVSKKIQNTAQIQDGSRNVFIV